MMATVLGVTLNHSLDENRKHLAVTEQVMLNLLGDLSRIALLTVEYDELQPYIDEVVADPHVETVLLADDRSRVVVSNEYSYIGNPIPELASSETRLWKYQEIKNASGLLGTLAISFSNKNLIETNREVFNLGVRIALIGMMLIAVVGIVIGFLLTRRLDKLASTAQRLADGDFGVRTGMSGHDELSIVGQAFNRMAENVECNIKELKTLTDELENRVEERTVELAVARDTLEDQVAERTEDLKTTNLALERSRVALHELVRITSAPDLSHDERLARLLDTGREYYSLPVAVLASVEGIEHRACKISGDASLLPNQSGPLDNRCAAQLIERHGEPLDIPNLQKNLSPDSACLKLGWCSYLGAAVLVEGRVHCTLEFAGTEIRDAMLSQWDHDLLKVMAQWIGDELERQMAYDFQQRHQAEFARVSRISAIGEMAASLAHELNQPLTGAINYSSGCLRLLREGDWDPKKLIKGMERTVEGATRAANIIRQIREFVQKGDEKHTLVDLNNAVTNVATLVTLEARRHRVGIELDLTSNLPLVKGNMIQLEQVILNFIRNGIDAMETVKPVVRRLKITTRRNGGTVSVAAEDTGEGVPADVLPKIFDAFYSTKPDGMGIGLSISRSIVESHQGKITARSKPDGGAKFSFELPIA